jgi:helix-turn-helix protein
VRRRSASSSSSRRDGAGVVADRGYDSDVSSSTSCASECARSFPSRCHRKTPRLLDAAAYVHRNVVERWFGRLKVFRRDALRQDRSLLSRIRRACRNAHRALRVAFHAGIGIGLMRHTRFTFTLEPTASQKEALCRHVGAARFAFNQCLRFVQDALAAKKTDGAVAVPWSGFDLINAFNAWKLKPAAGVGAEGRAGLCWRAEICQPAFEDKSVNTL